MADDRIPGASSSDLLDEAQSAEAFSTQVERSGDVAVVSAGDELDMSTAPALAATLDALLQADVSRVVLDLTSVTFLGSAGIGVVLDVANRAGVQEPGVAFRVVAPESHRAVRRPWDAMNLHAVVPLFATRDEAAS
jgi:anti-sigma B factor antagonist